MEIKIHRRTNFLETIIEFSSEILTTFPNCKLYVITSYNETYKEIIIKDDIARYGFIQYDDGYYYKFKIENLTEDEETFIRLKYS